MTRHKIRGAGCACALLTLTACHQAPDDVDVESRAVTAPTDPLQFEAAADWHVTQGTAQSLTITTTRTQGNGALAVKAPQGYTRIDSKALSSSNPRLAGIDLGSVVSLDFM